MTRKKTKFVIAAGALSVIAVFGTIFAVVRSHQSAPGPKMVYSTAGYGGFVPANTAPSKPPASADSQAERLAGEISGAQDSYNAGKYGQSDRVAKAVVRESTGEASLPYRRAAADARQVLAYSAARCHDLTLARARFALLEQTAATLPDGGDQSYGFGEQAPTLEQEGAFQHAVCTAALGNKAAAEIEYRQFLSSFPTSPLVHAVRNRMAAMHGGDLPPVDAAAWEQAERISTKAEEALALQEAMCGPKCLAELLRRSGQKATVAALASELGTTAQGTSLAALAEALTRRGMHPQGVQLTEQGLAEQSLPLIAVITPGHYVIVDGLSIDRVKIWDPDAVGTTQGGPETIPAAVWRESWPGYALTIGGAHGLQQADSADGSHGPAGGV